MGISRSPKRARQLPYFSPVVALILGLTHQFPSPAQSIIPEANSTGTLVAIDGQQFNIQGGTLSGDGQNLFHSFEGFGLETGQIANFFTQAEIRNILGRVTGGTPSFIDGTIQVLGGSSHLYLMNPAGMIFGANARLNVPGDFVATTATRIGFGNDNWFNAVGTPNYQALVGTPSQFAFDLEQPTAIINAGDLAVTLGQNLTLLAGNVINTGKLQATAGNIIISAVPGTSLVKISQPGHLPSLEIEVNAEPEGEIIAFNALDLPELLTGADIETGLSLEAENSVLLHHSGVELPTETGSAIASGLLDVSGETGGSIHILGEQVGVIAGNIDASGKEGGGTVLIGGGKQGQGNIPNARHTYISKDSLITADATAAGDGGKIIVFAENYSGIYGTLTARGGDLGGEGGFIETSGMQGLDVTQVPDVGALLGNGGEWLIDPHNISIVAAGAGASNINTSSPFTAMGDNATLAIDLILTALAAGDVTIATGTSGSQAGNISLDTSLTFNLTAARTLTLDAAGAVQINQPIDGVTSSSPLNLVFKGNHANLSSGEGRVRIASNINTLGGNITAWGRSEIAGARGVELSSGFSLDSGGGEIELTGVSAGAAWQGVRNLGGIFSRGGDVNIVGEGNNSQGIQINGTLDSGGGAIALTGTGNNHAGVFISNPVLSGSGDITFTGTSNNHTGIRIGNTIDSDGGKIAFIGSSHSASSSHAGILMQNAPTIAANGGDIAFLGKIMQQLRRIVSMQF